MAIRTGPSSNEIVDEVGAQLHGRLHEIIHDNDILRQSEGFRKAYELYDRAEKELGKIPKEDLKYLPESGEIMDLAYSVKMGRDSFVSTFTTTIVKNIVKHVKLPFVEITLDEIRVRTKGRRKEVEITNIEAKLRPIKPVVKIIIQVLGIPTTVEVKFQIDADVKIPEINFSRTKEESEIQLVKIFADVKLSLLEVDVDSRQIKNVRTLGEKKIVVDLKGHKFSTLHSKECPHCGTPNPATANYCGECGKELEI